MEARRSSRVFGLVIAVIVLAAVAVALAAPDRGFVREASVTVGPHPHCASPPVPAPAEVAELRRLSVQPVGELACPVWWTVDRFVEPGGAIAAITLDRYEP